MLDAEANTMGGTLWLDVDADGTLEESPVTGFEYVGRVWLDASGKQGGQTTSDASGNYQCQNISDGS